MKDLSELQNELRRLSSDLDRLSAQVEELDSREDETDETFAALEELARQIPIRNRTLRALAPAEKERYLRLLSTAAALTNPLSPEQLLFLCRLSFGADAGFGAEELCRMAYQTDRLEWQAAASSLHGEAGLPLLLDLLIVSGLNGPMPERALDFAAGVAELLECPVEDAELTARLAAALLTADEEAFRAIQVKRPYAQLGYLVPEAWLTRDRYYCGSYRQKETAHPVVNENKNIEPFWLGFCISSTANLTQVELTPEVKVSPGSHVMRDQVLVDFNMRFLSDIDKETQKKLESPRQPICAPESGFVYYTSMDMENEATHVFVAGPFDSIERLTAWYKAQKN